MASQPVVRPTSQQLASGRRSLTKYESISSANLTVDPKAPQDTLIDDSVPSTPQYTINRHGEIVYYQENLSESGSLQHRENLSTSATAARFQASLPQVSTQQRETELRREKKWLEMSAKWDAWNKKKEHVKERARKGIPESLRGVFWPLFADSNKIRIAQYKRLGLEFDSTSMANLTQSMLIANSLDLTTSFDSSLYASSPSFSGSLDERQSFILPLGLGLAPKRHNGLNTPNKPVLQVLSNGEDGLHTSMTQNRSSEKPQHPTTPTTSRPPLTPTSNLISLTTNPDQPQPGPIKRAASNLSGKAANGQPDAKNASANDYQDNDMMPGNALQLPSAQSHSKPSPQSSYTMEPLQHSASSGLIDASVLQPPKKVHHTHSTSNTNQPFNPHNQAAQFSIIPEHGSESQQSQQFPSTIPETPTASTHTSPPLPLSSSPPLLPSSLINRLPSGPTASSNSSFPNASPISATQNLAAARPAQSGPAQAVYISPNVQPKRLPPPRVRPDGTTTEASDGSAPDLITSGYKNDEMSKEPVLDGTTSEEYVMVCDPVQAVMTLPRTSIASTDQNKFNSPVTLSTSEAHPPAFNLAHLPHMNTQTPTGSVSTLHKQQHDEQISVGGSLIIDEDRETPRTRTSRLPPPLPNATPAPATPSNATQAVAIGLATPSKRKKNSVVPSQLTDTQSTTKTAKDDDSISVISDVAPSTVNSINSLESVFSYTLTPGEVVPAGWSLYKRLSSTVSSFDQLIGKDVRRTFTNHIIFSTSQSEKMNTPRGRQYLADICRAYCHFDEDLGYCQGISFLVATLLMYMEAEDAFWCLVALLQHPRYNLRGLFTTGFPLLSEYMFVTKELMRKVDPKLYKHLENHGFTYSVCMPQWLMGLFVYTLPINIGLRIWDILLYEGHKILIRTALYMLRYYRNKLLAEDDLDAILFIMCHDVPHSKTMYADADAFIQGVHKISFTSADIVKLQKRYQIEKPPGPF